MTLAKIIFIQLETLKLLIESRCTRTVVFVYPSKALCKICPVLFSCRLSSFGKSAGLQNRKWEVRCLQTVPRSGRCVPRPRPNTDSEQCKKTVVTQPERSFHHKTRRCEEQDSRHHRRAAELAHAGERRGHQPGEVRRHRPADPADRRSCSHPPAVSAGKLCKTKSSTHFHTLNFFGGRGWIRTTEAESSRFTVCPHWPLGNTPIFFCVRRADCLYILPRAKQFVNHLQQILSQFLHQSLQQTRPMEKPPGNQCSRAVFLGAGDRS